jgi:hypothetical protein
VAPRQPGEAEFLTDKPLGFDADAILQHAEALLELEEHPGFKALMAILEDDGHAATSEFIGIDLMAPEGVEEMRDLQNRVGRSYWIREAIAQVLRQAAEMDLSETGVEE